MLYFDGPLVLPPPDGCPVVLGQPPPFAPPPLPPPRPPPPCPPPFEPPPPPLLPPPLPFPPLPPLPIVVSLLSRPWSSPTRSRRQACAYTNARRELRIRDWCSPNAPRWSEGRSTSRRSGRSSDPKERLPLAVHHGKHNQAVHMSLVGDRVRELRQHEAADRWNACGSVGPPRPCIGRLEDDVQPLEHHANELVAQPLASFVVPGCRVVQLVLGFSEENELHGGLSGER